MWEHGLPDSAIEDGWHIPFLPNPEASHARIHLNTPY